MTSELLTPPLSRRIPGARFVVHEGAGHAIILERPDEGAESILAFLAESEERST